MSKKLFNPPSLRIKLRPILKPYASKPSAREAGTAVYGDMVVPIKDIPRAVITRNVLRRGVARHHIFVLKVTYIIFRPVPYEIIKIIFFDILSRYKTPSPA